MKEALLNVEKYKLINRGDVVGVACSGGRDSMALLHFLNNISKSQKFSIRAINIDHCLRKNSASDSLFVENYCKKNFIPFENFKVDVKSLCEKENLSIEQGARNARYHIFNLLLQKDIVNKIALGHHLQDQAETILLNIFRGTGLAGARGMDFLHQQYIRPFLSISRTEIQAYITKNEIPFVDDETNFANDYSRNYLRNLVMPTIRNKWSQADQMIFNFGEVCKEDDEFICSLAQSTTLHTYDNCVKIPLSDFTAAPSLIKRVVMRATKEINANLNFEKKHILALIDLALKNKNGDKINLPNKLVAIKEYNFITLINKNERAKPFNFPLQRGRIDIKNFGLIDLGVTRDFSLSNHTHLVDYNKVPKEAIWRTRTNGDYFEKFGGGTKKLNDYFINKKIPSRLRDSLPLLAYDNEIYVIAGIEISEKARIDEHTKTAWSIDVLKY